MRTDTDVLVTQYPARFERRRNVAPIDFGGGPKMWRLAGHWQHRETVPRRRRWTMVRDVLARYGENATDVTDAIRAEYKGIAKADKEFRAVVVRRDGYAVLMTFEQIARWP